MIPTEEQIKRFWKYVNKRGENDCWEWIGSKQKTGYGHVGILKPHRTTVGAHRFSWMIHYGEIPKGISVCHKCDNPSCVNPKHLFLGTVKDNIHDMLWKGRRKVKAGGRPMTEDQWRRWLTILYLHFVEKMPTNLIADKFGVSGSAIRNALHKKSRL